MQKVLFGHRGAAYEAPENTLAGFSYAWEIGVRAFELDVRLSADQQLVILHDESLQRTAGVARKVGELTAAQLAELPAAGLFPGWHTKAAVPLLEDVLKTFAQQTKSWEIEIKSDSPEHLEILCPRLVDQIERFEIASRAVVTSFDPLALEIMRRIAPDLRRGFISHYDQPEHLETALRLGCCRACIPLHFSHKATVQAAHAAGLSVTGWQGDSVEMLETLLDWDVDAITSNRPSLALDFLRQRGLL
jgi:glycerophosphoryl diester phosphodiesterase